MKLKLLALFSFAALAGNAAADGASSLYDFAADHALGSAWTPPPATNTFTVIEVMAAAPPVRMAFSFFAPTNAAKLWFRMQGLGYQNKGYVECEQTRSSVPLNNDHCVFDYPANKLNGIGGPLGVLSFTLPGLAFATNAWNTLDFWYTNTDNVSTGYRVLEMRVLDASGNAIPTVADAGDPVIGENLGYFLTDRKGDIQSNPIDSSGAQLSYVTDAQGYPIPILAEGLDWYWTTLYDQDGNLVANLVDDYGDPIAPLFDADGNLYHVLVGPNGYPVSSVVDSGGSALVRDADIATVAMGLGADNTYRGVPFAVYPGGSITAGFYSQFAFDSYGEWARILGTNGLPLANPVDSQGGLIGYVADNRGYPLTGITDTSGYAYSVSVDQAGRALPIVMDTDLLAPISMGGVYGVIGAVTKPLGTANTPVLHYSDPSSYSSSDIAAGRWLWTNAPLVKYWGGPAMNARCADCHATDASDLKFFGYSDLSIFERSKFHGLSPVQARQIVAWIRNSAEPTVGTPWDPPYQPGPGQSSRPYVEWAAGAGLKWVLPDDTKTWKYLFPSSNVVVSFTNTIDVRELPIAIPLPLWNEWLPTLSPKDAYPTNAYLPAVFGSLASALIETNPVYVRNYLADASTEFANFYSREVNPTSIGTSAAVQTAYQGINRLLTVRLWEVMHTHRMEGKAASMFSFPVDPHSWQLNWIFTSAPHFTLPKTGHILGDGSELTWGIRSHQWYWLQMVLNDSNHHRSGAGPIDFPYLLAFTKTGSQWGADSAAQTYTALIKSGESGSADPYNRDDAFFGFAVTRTEYLDYYPAGTEWATHTAAGRDVLIDAFITEYSRMVQSLGKSYFITIGDGGGDPSNTYTGLETDSTPVPPGAPPWNRQWAATMGIMEADGVSSGVMAKMISLAEYLWPYADWSRF